MGADTTPRKCLLVFSLLKKEIEKLKLLSFIDARQEISSVAYGPFDNGHILVGLSDGWLLAYEYPSLQRIESKQIYSTDENEERL